MRSRVYGTIAAVIVLALLPPIFTCSNPADSEPSDPAPSDEAAISGTLADSSGAALAGVTVMLVGDSLVLVDTTDSAGRFAFGPLDSGTYYITSAVSAAMTEVHYDGATADTVQVSVDPWPRPTGDELSAHAGPNRAVTPGTLDSVSTALWSALDGIVDRALAGLPKTAALPRQTVPGPGGGTAEVEVDMRMAADGFVVSAIALLRNYSDDSTLLSGGVARRVTGSSLTGDITSESHDVALACNGTYSGELTYAIRASGGKTGQFAGSCASTGDSAFSETITRARFDTWRSGGGDTSSTGDSTGDWMAAGSGMAFGARTYMPLTEGATWTYRSGVPGVPGGAQTYTVTAAGLTEGEADTYYRELARDDGNGAALYRHDGAMVYKYQQGQQLPTALRKGMAADSACGRPFFVFGVPAGTRWEHFSISDSSNPMLPIVITQATRYVGLEEVSVVYGTLSACARFDIATTMAMGADTSVQGMSVWLAPHVGVIKIERGTVLDGALTPYQVDELVSTSLGVGDTPESTSVQLLFQPFTGGELQVRNWRGDLFTLRAPALSFTTEGTITMTTMTSPPAVGIDSCLSPGVRIDLGGLTPRSALELTVSVAAAPLERGTAVLALAEPSPVLGISSTCVYALGVDTGYPGALYGEVLVDGVYAVMVPTKAEVDAQAACVVTQGMAKRAAAGSLGSYGWISLRGSALALLKWAEWHQWHGNDAAANDALSELSDLVKKATDDFLNGDPPQQTCDEEYLHAVGRYADLCHAVLDPGDPTVAAITTRLASLADQCWLRWELSISYQHTMDNGEMTEEKQYSGTVFIHADVALDTQGTGNGFPVSGGGSLIYSASGSEEECTYTETGDIDVSVSGEMRPKDGSIGGAAELVLKLEHTQHVNVQSCCPEECPFNEPPRTGGEMYRVVFPVQDSPFTAHHTYTQAYVTSEVEYVLTPVGTGL